MKKKITFVIGGCKSGKSNCAVRLAETYRVRKIFVATSVPFDDEMKDRIARHQAERDDSWKTIDAPVSLPETIAEHGHEGNVILVDCLTLWINNLLMMDEDLDKVAGKVDRLTKALSLASCPIVLVSNEVGAGIVPENRLARLFRDAAGMANQKIAAVADQVVWMVAGISNVIKGDA